MKHRLVTFAVLASLAAGAACGGDSDSSDSEATKPASQDSSPAATQAAKLTPAELGDAVFARASEGMKEVTKLVENHPAAATAKPQVEELKEATIQQLVSLGRQYETLSASDRAQVDAKVSSAFNQAANTDWYKAYASVTALYASEDPELARQIQSFNVITQYAFFELLKKQEPAEAQRLGIK